MAVFKQKTTGRDMSKQALGAELINMVGEGAVLEGALTAPGDIHVRGEVRGSVHAHGKVVIAQEGFVEGTVNAKNADIAGRVDGDVHVEARLILKSPARINGDLYTGRLIIEEGAIYNGSCTMGGLEAATKALGDGSRNAAAGDEAPLADAAGK